MKALKEKRVSLRSLLRRSLVILSLLALALAFAFASCSSDSGSSEPSEPTGPTDTTEPTTPPIERDPVKTVIAMTVLEHPNVPSFEGAMPNLSGLQVMVKWNDGTTDKLSGNDDRLTVHPPVAYVKQPGTHSWFSQYSLQYVDIDTVNDPFTDPYNDPIYGVNIWIPVVVALADTTGQSVTGTIAKVYEDLGVTAEDAKGLKFNGSYAPFAFGTQWGWTIKPGDNGYLLPAPDPTPSVPDPYDDGFPVDYYPIGSTDASGSARLQQRWEKILGITKDDWDDNVTKGSTVKKEAEKVGWYDESSPWAKASAISSDPRAWKIGHKADVVNSQGSIKDGDNVSYSPDPDSPLWMQKPDAIYLASLNKTATTNSGADAFYVRDQFVTIDKFYWVDRLDFVLSDNTAEMKKIKPRAADDKDYGGNNVSWSVSPGTPATFTTWIEEVGEETQVNWMWLLWEANLKFKVIYYDAGGTDKPSREIKMSDYIRAMYTVDQYGTPKATLPVFTGSPSDRAIWNSNNTAVAVVKNPSSPQYWALNDGDNPLYMTLFYYSDMIMPAFVKSATDNSLDPTGVPTTSVKGRGKVRTDVAVLNGNGAQIPLATDTVHKVAQFSSFDKERRESTAHDGYPTVLGTYLNADISHGWPTAPVTATNNTGYAEKYRTRMDLYDQLRKYWNGIWIYESQDPDWPDPIKMTVNRWYHFDGHQGGPLGTETDQGYVVAGLTKPLQAGKYQFYGLSDYDLDEIEDEEERTLEVLFPAPPSVGPSEDDTVEFSYWVKP